jgi:hypothetical protein
VKSDQDQPPVDLPGWAAFLDGQIEFLRAEFQRCQAALADAEERRALVRRLLELDKGAPANGNAADRDPEVDSTHHRIGTTANSELEEAVADILGEAGGPLHVSDIRTRLIDAGVRIPGKGDDANIIVRLRKAPDQFTRTARGTYALASWGLRSLDEDASRRRKARSSR